MSQSSSLQTFAVEGRKERKRRSDNNEWARRRRGEQRRMDGWENSRTRKSVMDNTCTAPSLRSKTVSSAASYLFVWKTGFAARRGHCLHRQMDASHTHTHTHTHTHAHTHTHTHTDKHTLQWFPDSSIYQHATEEKPAEHTRTPAWINCHRVLF